LDLFIPRINLKAAKKKKLTPKEKVIRLEIIRILNDYKPGWTYHQCKDGNILNEYNGLKQTGVFERLKFGNEKKRYPNEAPKISIELVPSTCWFDNLRSNLDPKDWDKLRKNTYSKANYRCEICNGKGPKWPVECHEIWHYDDDLKIQKLVGLIALCPSCHEIKHMGFAELKDRNDIATARLAIINGWSYLEAKKYISDQFDVWHERSSYNWKLNTSWLEEQGIRTSFKQPAFDNKHKSEVIIETKEV
jgi:5-methylcytosine-specific restriction endonuclease McrA